MRRCSRGLRRRGLRDAGHSLRGSLPAARAARRRPVSGWHGHCSAERRPPPGSPMRRSLFLLAALVAPALARADGLERSIAVAPGERLRIELAQGDVDVFTHDADEVRIEARASGLGAGGVEFFVTREAGEIVLRSRAERWLEWLGSGPSVSVRAWVPRHLGLAVETSGHVAARDGGVLLVPAPPVTR